jgi:hypothetical protein
MALGQWGKALSIGLPGIATAKKRMQSMAETGFPQAPKTLLNNMRGQFPQMGNPGTSSAAGFGPGSFPGTATKSVGGGTMIIPPPTPRPGPGTMTAQLDPMRGGPSPTFNSIAGNRGLIPLTQPKGSQIQTNPNSPFLNPYSDYGGMKPGKNGVKSNIPQDWFHTGAGQEAGETNPQAEYTNFMAFQKGGGGQDRYGAWMRSLYPQLRNSFDAAVQHNPELTWRKYLKTINGKLDELFAEQNPDVKGTNLATQTKTIYQG